MLDKVPQNWVIKSMKSNMIFRTSICDKRSTPIIRHTTFKKQGLS